MNSNPLKLGVTFHSFANEYCSMQWSFEDMMQIATLLGGGVEIVGPSHHRCFPDVSDEFERAFKSSIERYGLTATCYGTYADPFTYPNRDLSADELTEYTLRQLAGAVKLGIPVARLQYFAAPIVERVLPFAEKHHLKLGYELHAPLTVESQQTQSLIEQIRRLASPCLGLIPDAGIFARSIPAYLRNQILRDGMPERYLQLALELWQAGVPLPDASAAILKAGASSRQFVTLERFWGSFGQSSPSALQTIAPHIIHIHAKFFSMSNGDEPDVRYKELVTELVRMGYRGWISSEYEGAQTDTFEVVSAQQAMIRRYEAEARSPS